jgi:hypothetical protein
MDASGELALSLIIDRVRNAGIEISFAGFHQNVIDVLTRTGMIKKIGIHRIFPSIDKALNAVHPETHKTSVEKANCPLKKVIYFDEYDSQKGIISRLHPWWHRHR